MTYHWKALDAGYKFSLDLTSIRSLHVKLWAPKVVGVPTLAIWGFILGSPRTKCHLDVGFVERHIIYYKGEGGGLPQVQTVVSLVSLSCSWLVLTPKVFQLCTNHLVLVLCRPIWVSEACQFVLVPSRSSNTPLYPSKVLQAREHPPTPCSSVVFCLGLTFESFKELGARHWTPLNLKMLNFLLKKDSTTKKSYWNWANGHFIIIEYELYLLIWESKLCNGEDLLDTTSNITTTSFSQSFFGL